MGIKSLNRSEVGVLVSACVVSLGLVGGAVFFSGGTDTVVAAAAATTTTSEAPATTTVPPSTSTVAPTTTTEQPATTTTTTTAAPRLSTGESSSGQTQTPAPVVVVPAPTTTAAPPTTEAPQVVIADTRVPIGSMVGQDVTLARSTYEGEGFVVAVDLTCTGTVGGDIVLAQTPENTLVEPGSAVAMTAEAPDCVQVPNVVGSLRDNAHCFSTCDYARDLFAAAGLTNYSESGVFASNCRVVSSQTPAAGTWVRSGVAVVAIEEGDAVACIG